MTVAQRLFQVLITSLVVVGMNLGSTCWCWSLGSPCAAGARPAVALHAMGAVRQCCCAKAGRPCRCGSRCGARQSSEKNVPAPVTPRGSQTAGMQVLGLGGAPLALVADVAGMRHAFAHDAHLSGPGGASLQLQHVRLQV